MLLLWWLVWIMCTVYCHHCNYNNYCSCYYIPTTIRPSHMHHTGTLHTRQYKYKQPPLFLSIAKQKVCRQREQLRTTRKNIETHQHQQQEQEQQWNDVVIHSTTETPTAPPSLSSNSINERINERTTTTTTRRQALAHTIQPLVTVSTCCCFLFPQEAVSTQNSCYDMNDKVDHSTTTKVGSNKNFTFCTKLGIDRIGSKSSDELQYYNINKYKYINSNSNNMMTNVLWNKINTAAEPLYYPTFMFGAWNTTVTINNIISGCDTDTNLLPVVKEGEILKSLSSSASETIADHAVDSLLLTINDMQYQYFTTLANTLQNQITMNLGTGIPQTKIIANRAYNSIHGELVLLNTILGYITVPSIHNKSDFLPIISIPSDVSDIVWDYRSSTNPTLVSWNDEEDQHFERDVVSYNVETYNDTIFSTLEYHRLTKVEQKKWSAPNRINDVLYKATIETETITEYHKLSDNVVHAKSRMIIRTTTPTTGATADGVASNGNSRNNNAISSSSSSSSSTTMMTIVVADYDSQMQRIVQSFTTTPSQTNDDDDDDDDDDIIADTTTSTAAAVSKTSCRPCVETPRGIVQCY